MNIYLPSPASADTSALPSTKSVEFAEWMCGEVLKKVPHLHFVFSIPKILRRYFLYDRSLLSELSRCVWESLKIFFGRPFRKGVRFRAVIAIQTFRDFFGISSSLPYFLHGQMFLWQGGFPAWRLDLILRI